MAQKSKGTFGAQKSRAAQGRLRIRKHAVLPAPFWLKYNRKNLPIRQYGEIFSADFISKIHWQNCFAPKKSKFCAELRRDGAGMLTHGKTAQRRSPCKICLLRRMFSYAESAKEAPFFIAARKRGFFRAQRARGVYAARKGCSFFAPIGRRGFNRSAAALHPFSRASAGGGAARTPRHQRGYSLSEENTPFEPPRERRGASPLDPRHCRSGA